MPVSWSACACACFNSFKPKTPTALEYINFSFRMLHYWWKVALKAEAANMRYWAFLAFHLHFFVFFVFVFLSQSHCGIYRCIRPRKVRLAAINSGSHSHRQSCVNPKTHACTTHLRLPPEQHHLVHSLLPFHGKLTQRVRRNASSFSVGNNHILERTRHAIKLDSAWACVRMVNSCSVYRKKSLIPGGSGAKSIGILWWGESIGRSKG